MQFKLVSKFKPTGDQPQAIEKLVNDAVAKDFTVRCEIMPLAEAKSSGAIYMIKSPYPDPVKVYTIGEGEDVFSRELCGGPHVNRTGEIGGFKILKEESSSAGIRRIRATVIP